MRKHHLTAPLLMAALVVSASAHAEDPKPAPAAAPALPTAPALPPAPQSGFPVLPGAAQPAPAALPQQGQPQQGQQAPLPAHQAAQNEAAAQFRAHAAQSGWTQIYSPPGWPQQQPGATPPSPADIAFQQAIQGTLPMTPDMIRQFKAMMDQSMREAAQPVGKVPSPISRSLTLSLKPGERPPLVRLYPGNATTLTFSDVTGAPWPVMSVTAGNPTAYTASEAGEKGKTNMVVVSPLTPHQMANNLVVTLVDHPVPIIFELQTGTGDVDVRVDVGLETRGPKAAYDIVGSTSLPPTNDPTVQAFLDGVPPKGARKVATSSRMVEAWRMNDMIYVRTPLEVLSPAYVGRARNVSGTNVFTMVDAPVLLVSQDGRMASVTIER